MRESQVLQVNTGGIKVFPEEIEDKIEKAGILSDYRWFIAGAPDKDLGTKVILIIETLSEKETSPEQLLHKVREVLDPFERPKILYFVSSLFETPTGKIKRDLKLYDLPST